MVRINKVYTRTGDSGTTGLADGSRREKSSVRIAAYGTVDEAISMLGVAILYAEEPYRTILTRLQNELFDCGADIANPGTEFLPGAPQPRHPQLRVLDSQVTHLEEEIDRLNADLPSLKSFILPGGTPLAAHIHLARTIVRRAERHAVAAAQTETVNPIAIRYLNRLSDLLFVIARHANRATGDPLWVPGATR